MESPISEKMIQPKLICRKCGFIQEYHDTKKRCPKCGRAYKDKIWSGK